MKRIRDGDTINTPYDYSGRDWRARRADKHNKTYADALDMRVTEEYSIKLNPNVIS